MKGADSRLFQHSSPCSPATRHSAGHPAFLHILKTLVQSSVRKGSFNSRDNCPERCHDSLQASTVWLALSPLRRATGRRVSHLLSRCSRDSSASPFPYNYKVPAHPKTTQHGKKRCREASEQSRYSNTFPSCSQVLLRP